MAAIDIADAFLTVDQRKPTLVVCGDLLFALGKVLGQRDGSQQWYDSVTSFTRRKLNFESCAAYPCAEQARCRAST